MDDRSDKVSPLADPFWLGNWCVEKSINQLTRGHEKVKLEPVTMRVLVCLAEKAGEVVTREELEAKVWPRMVVGYDSLNNAIAKLRKAFDDDRHRPRFIETIPKVGYRLIADIADSPEERLPRKLAAILYADVAGYSRLTGEDEDATHRRLSEYLDLIATSVENLRGRVMHYAGDAVLAMFDAAVDALSCAASIQEELKTRNEKLPDERKVEFRIGINLGDVIEARGDIYGDGVNVAARLESLAEPGGICISEAVRTSVGSKLSLDYKFLGEQRVKNIVEPVRAYSVELTSEIHARSESPKQKTYRRSLVVVPVVILVGFAIAVIWNIYGREPVPAGSPSQTQIPKSALPDTVVEKSAPVSSELTGKPSIAVMPFKNLSGDVEQEYFSDGMTDDLITDLSRISGLFVIARNSVFTYKNKPVNLTQVANELGVRYVLDGSVRRTGDKVRINAQLIDATTGGHLWAERYDGSLGDVFGLQDKVTRRIVDALKVKLTPQETVIATQKGIVGHKGTNSVAAYDEFLKGWQLLLRKTPEDAAQAIAYFKSALKIDPGYRRPYVGLAQVYWENSTDVKFNQLIWGNESDLGAWGGLGYVNDVAAWTFLQKASDSSSPQAYALAARMMQRQRRFQEAMQKAQQAVSLGPSDPLAHDALIENLIYSGNAEEALRRIDESIVLDPGLPGEKLFLKGLAYYTLGRLEEALSVIERARSHNPIQTRYAAVQAVTLAELDRTEEAKAALQDYRSALAESSISLNWTNLHWPFEEIEQAKRFAEGLLRRDYRIPCNVPIWFQHEID